MTNPPQPYPGDLIALLPDATSYRRTFVDSLGRPLEGELTVERLNPATDETTVIIATPVPVPLAGGLFAADLPPGTYRIRGQLRTASGEQVAYDNTVTIR